MATKRDYYEVLGVDKKATGADIKSAYKKQALKWHPDRNQDKKAEAEEKFKEINEAYQVLSDEKKKGQYDQFGHAAFDPSAGMGGAGNPFGGGYQQGPFTWSYTTSGGGQPNMDFGDPFEIFEQFFGGGFGGYSQAARRPRYSLSISFEEAVFGTTKDVSIDGKKKTIKVPAGANDGTRIRFDEFDVTLNVLPHEYIRRDGYDLFIDQHISFVTATLGGKVALNLLDKKLQMKVQTGTQSHTMVRLRGEGVQHLQSRGKGDLYVRLIVDVPNRISREQKKVLEMYRDLSE